MSDNSEIIAALDASLESGMKPGDLAALLMERKRLMDLNAAKVDQPVLETKPTAADITAIQAALFAPQSPDPNPMYGLDLLVQTVGDTANKNNAEDVLFAALRVVRKAWGMMPHLGPIEDFASQAVKDKLAEAATVKAETRGISQ